MIQQYRHKNTSVSLVNYHFCWIVRRKRRGLTGSVKHRIKGRTAKFLRKEFSVLMKLPSMWTRAYFVSTAGNVASSTIQKYIEAQGKD